MPITVQNQSPPTAKQKCFIISPIGDDGSAIRNGADWFLRGIVYPALEATFTIDRADSDRRSGLITAQIIEKIQEADLIVADLTDHNPNVHYELGVAHTLGKHVIPMIIKGQRPPFDNAAMRTIFYCRDHPDDQAAAVDALCAAADSALRGKP